jgi:hypothetical protein
LPERVKMSAIKEDFNYIDHNFKIKIESLYDFDRNVDEESLVVKYMFPTFDKVVESMIFCLKNKKEINLNYKSNHLVTL